MDGSYQLLAARYVRKQTRQLTRQLEGALKADDPEFVHQARVASRRLRAGFRVFGGCFARKQVRRWRKHICRLTQGLGAARDRDVQIEFVRGFLSELNEKAYRPGIARLLLRLEQQRQALQPQVIKAVNRLQARGITDEMLAAAKRAVSKGKRRNLSLQSRFVFSQAEEQIGDRLNELMHYEDSLGDPLDQEQHHAMRIAGKRLRYTMEVYQPVYEGRLDEFVKAVKGLQALLGEVHDCDVWVEHWTAFVEEERDRTLAYFGHTRPFGRLLVGLDHLRQERQKRRQEVFGQLTAYWQELNHQAVWERLIRQIQWPMEPSNGRELARDGPAANPQPELPGQGGDGKPHHPDRQGLARPTKARASALPR